MSAAPILHLGAHPIIIDCDPTGTGFDHDDLRAKITSRTRAILPVYLWGRADPHHDQLHALAAEHDFPVIVDACQALGTTTADGEQVGLAGVAACFSTHEMKILSTGEGGFIATNDPVLAGHARGYRSHWLNPPQGDLPLSRPAHNFRLAAPLAAIGRRELAKLDTVAARRRELTAHLSTLLSHVPHLTPADAPAGQRWNGYSPLYHLDVDRPRALAQHLAHEGVPNSTGTFGLVPLDHRPAFTTEPNRPCGCVAAAALLDGILAVCLTRQDDETSIRRYAATIAKEVTRWADA